MRSTLSSVRHSPDGSPLTVALLYAPGDAAQAGMVAQFLSQAGATIIDRSSAASSADGVVVLISAGAVNDSSWMAAAGSLSSDRVIPVRLGPVNADLVPQALRVPNWIDWAPGSLGQVLAGLLSDPSRRAISRQLTHAAQAWSRARGDDRLLIGDYRRARQMQDILAELAADPMARPEENTVAFVNRSLAVSRRRHRRRRRWRIVSAIAALAGLAAAVIYLPQIVAKHYNNREAIVTTGDQAMLADLPEWSAANAGALLLTGTPQEKTLARATILDALRQSWSISNADWMPSVVNLVTYDAGARALLLYRARHGTGVAVFDVRTGQILSSRVLNGNFQDAAVSPDGQAVLAGSGIATMSLRTGQVREVTSQGDFAKVVLAGTGKAVAATTRAGLYVVSLASKHVRRVGSYRSILRVVPANRHAVSALVMTSPGGYKIINAVSGQVLASATVPGTLQSGAVAPDGQHAIVAGRDGQFWTFGSDQPPHPTGIAVPAEYNAATWASAGRVIIASSDFEGQVYYLPRSEYLGTVCRDVSQLNEVRFEPGTGTVGCLGGSGVNSFWNLPLPPLASAPRAMSTRTTSTEHDLTLTAHGTSFQMFWAAPTGRLDTPNLHWFDATITAVMMSPDAKQAVLGSASGEAAVIDAGPASIVEGGDWQVPDSSPIVAAGWMGDVPVVTTRSGQSWVVPGCSRCATDARLLQTLRTRLTGCFTSRQLQNIAGSVRDELGLRMCPLLSSIARG